LSSCNRILSPIAERFVLRCSWCPMKNGSGILSPGCAERCCVRLATRRSRNGLMAPASMTTNDDDRPPISLAAERKQRERDFTAERAELLQELKDIGVEAPELAASSQVPRPSSGLSGSWRGVEMEASQRDSTPNPLLVSLERFLQHLILDRATGDSKPRHKAAT